MPRTSEADPAGLPLVVTRKAALAAGLTPGRIGWLTESGRWTVIARGIYLRERSLPRGTDLPAALDRAHVHRAAAASANRPGSVIHAASAVLMHGLPLVTGTPPLVELAVRRAARREERHGVRSRMSTLTDTDIVMVPVEGLDLRAVTSVARTWVDIARSHPLGDTLSVGDAALRRGLMCSADVLAAIENLGPARGVRRAARAVALLDARRESPLESGSCARFIEWGLPQPRLQHTFIDADGHVIARSDCDWPEQRVIGFADGHAKYGLDPRRDRAERRQESRLRPYGIVARWGWSDMAAGVPLFSLLAPLLGFTGPMRTSDRWGI